MKPLKRILSLALLALLLLPCLTGCATTLRGTYELRAGEGEVVLTYVFHLGGTLEVYSGERESGEEPLDEICYEIDGGFFYTWPKDGSREDAKAYFFSRGKDDAGPYLEIDGTRYYKK